jgi:hypothetical protein
MQRKLTLPDLPKVTTCFPTHMLRNRKIKYGMYLRIEIGILNYSYVMILSRVPVPAYLKSVILYALFPIGFCHVILSSNDVFLRVSCMFVENEWFMGEVIRI